MSQEAMNALDSEPHLKTSSRSPERFPGRFSESLPPTSQIINANSDFGFSAKPRCFYHPVLLVCAPSALLPGVWTPRGLSLCCASPFALHIDTLVSKGQSISFSSSVARAHSATELQGLTKVLLT